MAVNRFVLNGISYHGHGAINEIPGIIKGKGFQKAFVASDPDLVKFGVTAKVTDILEQNGIAYELYSEQYLEALDYRKEQGLVLICSYKIRQNNCKNILPGQRAE